MTVPESRALSNVLIIGSGRWARVITEVLDDVLPPDVSVSMYSRYHAAALSRWCSKKQFRRHIVAHAKKPTRVPNSKSAVLVINAARAHAETVEWALKNSFPVLVEKPIGMSGKEAERILALSVERNVPLAATNVFLFAEFFENFIRLARQSGPIEAIRVEWEDPAVEIRYGEYKSYDSSVPIFVDWLPHIVAMIETLIGSASASCDTVDVRRGGASLRLKLAFNEVGCTIDLTRSGTVRKRLLDVSTPRDELRLDFSNEPGFITRSGITEKAAQYRDPKRGPVAYMLMAFLDLVTDGKDEKRLDPSIGLRACRLCDQIYPIYQEAVHAWLISAISKNQKSDDFVYALTEILQIDGRLPESALKSRLKAVMNHLEDESLRMRLSKTADMEQFASILGDLV